MKKFTLLALLAGVLAGGPAAAQTAITIAAARALAPTANNTAGPTVTVRGIVTNGAELGSATSIVRYMQDRSGAGVAVFSTGAGAYAAALNTLVPGDSIEVTGGLKMYRGLLEIDPISALTVLAGNRPVPAPVVFAAANAAAAYDERYEGVLVRINGLTSVNELSGASVGAFKANTTYKLNNTATLVTYVPANSNGPDGLIGKPSPSGTFDAVGIVSQFSPSATSTTGGYQLLSRKYGDFIQGLTPNLTTPPVVSNISTTGFTVSFGTANAGDTQLAYATSPTGTFTAVPGSTALSTAHSQALTGLQPATIYYVQAVSVNAVGRSESRAVPMITQSLSTGRMRAYFTNAVDNTLALPGNDAVYLPSGHIADTLASYIGRARKTLDIAIYNWNSQTIATAVNAAYDRKVKVRVIYEDDNANASIKGPAAVILNPLVPRVGRPAQAGSSGSAIMHNKFVVIDADTSNANVPWVWTGSTNWTANQLSVDRNSAVAVQDQSLARVYTVEFNEMWGSSTLTAGTTLFGNRKTDNTPHYLRIGGRDVQSWFSPSDNVNGHLIETVQTADNDLHVASMLVTRSDVARAIRDQILLKRIAGCSEGVTNDTSATDASGFNFRLLRTALGSRMIKKTGSYIFHHKYLIVDAGAAQSDPTVFLGSHNWTASADNENDENTLVIHDARIVNQYYQEFAARVAEQNIAGVAVCRLVLATKAGSVQARTLQAYPNPARGSFQLHLAGGAAARTATVVLRDVTGRVVLTQTQPLTGTDLTIDATALKAGLYLVQVTTPEAVQTSRVVVQ